MNEEQKQLTMGSYLVYLGTSILLICSAVFLLSSCDNSLPGEAPASGEMIELNISLTNKTYNDEGAITPDTHNGIIEPETVVVPLGNDIYLYGTLEADPAERVRATSSLAEGTKVHVIAYSAETGDPVANAAYAVEGGKLTAMGGTLKVPRGAYDLVAYSYNTTEDPGYQTALAANPARHDLLWGKTSVQPDEVSSESVNITMSHRFSKVKLVVNTSNVSSKPVIKAVGNVTVAPSYAGSLEVKGGGFTKNGSSSPVSLPSGAGKWANLNTPSVTSSDALLYTNGENSVTVNIASITLATYGDLGLSTLPIRFKRIMEPGKSYTLTVSFKKVVWSGSNIYWDGQKLTFDAAGSNSHNDYQGVFFKWGSLIGVAPTGNSFGNGTTIYVPTYSSHSWTPRTIDKIVLDVTHNGDDWEEIPYARGGKTADRNINYLTTLPEDSFPSYKGDICLYIGKNGGPSGYRMPTSSELGTSSSSQSEIPWNGTNPVGGGWLWKGDGSVTTGVETGKGSISVGATSQGSSGGAILFPVAGVRASDIYDPSKYGMLGDVGTAGYYWSSSVSSATGAYCLSFDSSKVRPGTTTTRRTGLSVRCVKG